MKMIYPTFKDIKTFYVWGCYKNEQIKWYVDMGVIDKEEYALITGEKYPEAKDEKSQV
ncbi:MULTISPECIES: XkdX family protein [Staphylococcus]|nr:MULTISPECIES: XkdX family protein [Staphylococcus]YP_008320255.1 XkdX family protein [Staphylococcus phage SA13]MBN4932831.1 XkdX family protein [Staphylococcus sp. EG-SA-6]HDH6254639.1 XkdX family protein [Staphylococcus aureus LTCF-9-33]HDH6259993.1 XkdX family protein [Staphylococcus aureus LTCF-8-31]HDH6263033.1 XkdX family protein [Staphylococcus aureus LTCF-9-32]HDH6397882.1 XkdX family protein [Staphylococcus aureus P091449]HDH6435506.1 XkdX family protein [Staphylococcus aureus MR